MSNQAKKGQVTVITEDVRKADTKALITNGTDAFPEDTFTGQYWTGGTVGAGVAIIEPMFKPGTLHAMITQNNTLAQCVEAMEVNIDGTGHSIDLAKEGDSDDKAEKDMLEEFFREPYPGKSMIEIRRSFRRDLEATGTGYLEVIRTADDEVAMMNWLDCNEMRMLRYDAPIPVEKTVTRNGKEITLKVRTRERRFVQYINGKKIYFKEFGASRDIDRDTGEWARQGVRLPVERRGSEVLHFIGNKEPKTPYGSPRWINQLPSILGSRKAEEFNLEFFDGGGIPPVLVLVEGGTLGEDVRRDLRNHLSGKQNKHRAAIVEAISTSGTIDSAGTVRVRVERFGAERQQDAMFQNYDTSTSEHVRVSFRLPPMFLGKSADYNFATAYTAYMVAEAQVFYPERDEFDSRINKTIVKALGAKKYVFRSLPLTLVDVTNQLKAMELAIGNKLIKAEEAVNKLNEVTGLAMEVDPKADLNPPPPVPAPGSPDPSQDPQNAPTGAKTPPDPSSPAPKNIKQPTASPAPASGTTPDRARDPKKANPQEVGTGARAVNRKSDNSELVKLATEWMECMGVIGKEAQSLYSHTAKSRIAKEVADLDPEDTKMFSAVVASRLLVGSSSDFAGLTELCGHANELVES